MKNLSLDGSYVYNRKRLVKNRIKMSLWKYFSGRLKLKMVVKDKYLSKSLDV
jgi:hypothetical protein